MRKIKWAITLLLLFTTTAKSQYVCLDKTEIKKLGALIKFDPVVMKMYLALQASADVALTQEPNPIDTIVSEGHLSTDPKKIRTQKSLADMNKIYALAFAYQITTKKEYLQKCIDYIIAWATVNHGMGNPINDTKLDPLLEGYDLVKDEINASKRKSIETWLMQVADAEIAHPRFKSANKSAHNNWNSHRIKVVGLIAYILDNKEYKTFTDTSLQTQIQKNLYANGSGMDFEERDALHYHTYTLEPLLKIATVIKRATGADYFIYSSSTGSSMQKSMAFLRPFTAGEQVHHEFVNSKVAFDRQRAENKEPGYTIGADFKPEAAIEVLSYAAYFEPSYLDIVKKLLNTSGTYPNWQSVLNIVRTSQKN
jgi:hypothetical protein